MSDITDALKNADEIAELTGRDRADVIEDLLDDGLLNNSHLIMDNTSAIDKATKMVGKTHKLLTALIPILLLVATSGLEIGGIINLTGVDDPLREDNETVTNEIYWGCMDYSANNYDSMANEDDGTCTYDAEPAPEPQPEPEPEPEPEENETVICDPFFYDYTMDYKDDNKTGLILTYDVDINCDEEQGVTVQFLAYKSNSSYGSEPENYSIDKFDVYNGDIGYRNMTLCALPKDEYDVYVYLIDEDENIITEEKWLAVVIEE